MKQQNDEAADPSDSSVTASTDVVRGWKRVLFLTLAGVFFVVGIVGTVVPGMPTTPFLLLTSYYLVRTHPSLNQRLLRLRFIGPVLVDWQQRGGVRRNVKVKAIVFVCLAVAASLYFGGLSALPTTILVICALVGICVILNLPSA